MEGEDQRLVQHLVDTVHQSGMVIGENDDQDQRAFGASQHLLQTFSRFLLLLFHVLDPVPQNTP